MSIRVMQSVWEHSTQSGGALVLLLAIADNAHDDGDGAYPSIATLAQKSRMSGRNVNLLLKQLAEAGEIAIRRGAGPNGVNVYRVLLPGLSTPEKISPLKRFHPEGGFTPGVKNPVGGGEKSGRGGVKPTSPKPLLNHQEPSMEPLGETHAARVTLATYQPGRNMVAWVAAHCPAVSLADAVENWRDWHTAKGDRINDFDASLRTWMRREKPDRSPGAIVATVITTDGREVQIGQRAHDNLRAIDAARGRDTPARNV